MKFPCEGVPGYNTVPKYVPKICVAALALIAILRQPLVADAQSSSVSPAPAKTNNGANKYFIEGTNALRRGDISAARMAFEQAVKLNPHNAEARNALGTILLAQNDAGGAAAQFREALRANPAFTKARVNLSNALLRQGDLDAATREGRAAVQAAPNNADAHWALARALAAASKTAEATASLRRAVELAPNRADLRDDFGALLVQQKQLDDGKAEF